jgi:hypothetical protein
MEVGQSPNWGCSAKEKKIVAINDNDDGDVSELVTSNNEKKFC